MIGSKEGLSHLPLTVINPGDVAIVPEPGYQAYLGGAILAGAEPYIAPLRPENGFLLNSWLRSHTVSRAEVQNILTALFQQPPQIAVADYTHQLLAVHHGSHAQLLARHFIDPFRHPGFGA